MACKLKNIVPVCSYNVDGIDGIKVLDFADFQGFDFLGEALYDSGTVTQVYASGNPATLPAGEGTKYTGDQKTGLYIHTLETFIPSSTGEILAALNLATRRRLIPFYRTRAGRWYTFGYEAGAVLIFTGQTAEVVGNLVTISAASIYPLFEVDPAALTFTEAGDYSPADYDTVNDYK